MGSRFWPGSTLRVSVRGLGCSLRLHFLLIVFCARVLPWGTFGAFVSGYFSNQGLARNFDDLSVKAWPKDLQGPKRLAISEF